MSFINPDQTPQGKLIRVPESPNPDRLGQYYHYIGNAQQCLADTVASGYWTAEQAQEYANGYTVCNSAFDVMRRNALIQNIKDDTALDYAPPFPYDASRTLFAQLDGLVDFQALGQRRHAGNDFNEAVDEATRAIASLFVDTDNITVSLTNDFSGFWRIALTRIIDGESFTLYLNCNTRLEPDQEKVAALSFIPASEIVYAFRDVASHNLLVSTILNAHPRLAINLPDDVARAIEVRRQTERLYQEQLVRLAQTDAIRPTLRVFTASEAIPQTGINVQAAANGVLGTNGVGPCVVVCARGKSADQELIIGEAHIDADQDPQVVLREMRTRFAQQGVTSQKVEMFAVGGWRSLDHLQRRILALANEFNIVGAMLNLKDQNVNGGNGDYLDVVIDRDGQIYYGNSFEIFNAQR